MRYLIVVVLLFFMQTIHAKNCKAFLAPAYDTSLSVTENFLSFITTLLDNHVLQPKYLDTLSNGDFSNPFRDPLARSEDIIYQSTFQDFINADLDKKQIVEWAKKMLQKSNDVEKEKAAKSKETANPFISLNFAKIKGGSFTIKSKFPDRDDRYTIKSFMVSRTKVTQKMWADVMGTNPSDKENGQSLMTLSIKGKNIDLYPDHPINNITWWSAIAFANKMSELDGLKPVYDLSKIKKWKGSVADGNLRPAKETDIRLIKINAPNENLELAEGYRLPTAAELEYLQTDRGRSKGMYFTGMTDRNLHKFMQFAEGGESIYPAAEFPYIIDSEIIFNLYTQDRDWCHDIITIELSRGSVPAAIIKNDSAYGGPPRSNTRATELPYSPSSTLSFRLVRSLTQ